MPTRKLLYSQPRKASYDPKVAIFESKERVFSASNESRLRTAIASFLRQGSVRCGRKMHRRKKICTVEVAKWSGIREPNPDMLPLYEAN